MATFLLILQLLVVLAMIFIGAKVGSIGLGIYGAVGVFILVFIFGLEPKEVARFIAECVERKSK